MQTFTEQAYEAGKAEWKPMLEYTAELHKKCTREPSSPFLYPWEEIGTGYVNGPAFGHIDITHAILDAICYDRVHARHQLLNYLNLQSSDGLIPGCIWLRRGEVNWSTEKGHPAYWPVAVQQYYDKYADVELLTKAYSALVRQIGWFERNRKAENRGFYYVDILKGQWESGVDEGLRYDDAVKGPYACVDATSHVYQMYTFAMRWAKLMELNRESERFEEEGSQLAEFIRGQLFDEQTSLFHDIWSVNKPQYRRLTLEGMWPMMTGAATEVQANRVIDENLLNPKRFLTKHPVPTVALEDPGFELRMWRGPSWNSMTYWVVRGCLLYGRNDAAKLIVERALDCTAEKFAETGTLWEFYHPHGGEQTELRRKHYYNQPCQEYMGHNPLIAMAALWSSLQ